MQRWKEQQKSFQTPYGTSFKVFSIGNCGLFNFTFLVPYGILYNQQYSSGLRIEQTEYFQMPSDLMNLLTEAKSYCLMNVLVEK